MSADAFWLARGGEVFGPYPLEQLREMSRAGELVDEDHLCREGVEPIWVPFAMWRKANLRTDTVKIPVTKRRQKGAAVTPKQRALLEYVKWVVPATSAEASEAISEVINNPAMKSRLENWTKDRLHLHPELYHEEVQEAKRREAYEHGQRPVYLQEWANEQLGLGHPLKRISQRVARDAVAYLDLNYPGWDADIWGEFGLEWEKVDRWFPPAVAATHPECVKKDGWSDWDEGRYRHL
jgi:hypothetical protein